MRAIEKSKVKSYLDNLLKQFSKKRNDEEVIPRYNSKNDNTIYEDQIKSQYSKYLTEVTKYQTILDELNNLINSGASKDEILSTCYKLGCSIKDLENSIDKINNNHLKIYCSVYRDHEKEIERLSIENPDDKPNIAHKTIEKNMNPEIVRISNEIFEFKKVFQKQMNS